MPRKEGIVLATMTVRKDMGLNVQRFRIILDVLRRTSPGIKILLPLNQFLQRLCPTRIANELMPQKLLSTRPPLRILGQALRDKILESTTILGSFQPRGRLLRNQEEHLHRMRASMRRLRVDHLDSSNTQRPDIRLVVIASLLDYLGRHPEWCTDECIPLRFDVDQLRCDAEIRQFYLSDIRKKDVRGFDVPMDLAFAVEIFQSLE